MPRLKFICPVTGDTVDTGMNIDDESFAALSDNTEFCCPYCTKPHRIDELPGWLLGDVLPELE